MSRKKYFEAENIDDLLDIVDIIPTEDEPKNSDEFDIDDDCDYFEDEE